MELRWIVSTAASSLHAAAALFDKGSLVDSRGSAERVAEFAAEVDGLRVDLTALGLEYRAFFEHAIPLSVRFDGIAPLAEVVLTKLVGGGFASEGARQQLTRRLLALERTFRQANPGSLAELELRAGPLGEQWEARGEGLLASLARLTCPEAIVAEADVILVLPVSGGLGVAHRLYNSVRIEAVLANPISELPETVRLGWLLSQLNLDLPMFAELLPPGRAAVAGPLAMLPAVLAAASEVEWARSDVETLAQAVAAWSPGAVEAELLWQWWDTYQTSDSTWGVALAALDRMLGGEGAE